MIKVFTAIGYIIGLLLGILKLLVFVAVEYWRPVLGWTLVALGAAVLAVLWPPVLIVYLLIGGAALLLRD